MWNRKRDPVRALPLRTGKESEGGGRRMGGHGGLAYWHTAAGLPGLRRRAGEQKKGTALPTAKSTPPLVPFVR